MEDDATADHLKPFDESGPDETLGRAASGALPGEGVKRHGDVTLAELQAQFTLLQHEFQLFQEGRTRPPTRARNDDPAGPAPGPRLRSPGGPGRADCAIARPAADTPRSQSVPSGARMLRNPSPADHRPDLILPRQPSAQPPPRISRPLHAAAAGSPASAVPPRPRPSAPVSERRLPSPTRHPRSAGKAPPERLAVNVAVNNGNKPQEKKVKKKVERPPWRDDFVVDPSPWSKELAQEQAAAAVTADVDSIDEAQPACAPKPDRGCDSKEHERQWRKGSGSDGDGYGRDAQASPVHASRAADAQAEDARSIQAPARRRPQPATTAGVRAAAVAAVIEAGRQQQLLEQQQGARHEVARVGMLLVIPTGPGAGMVQQEAAGIIDPARISPSSRASQIPSLPSPGSDSRPRTQQSRIPTFPGQLHQQPQSQQQQIHGQDDRNRRQSAPATGGPLGGIVAGVDRLVVNGDMSTSFSSDDPLGNSAENSQMPSSSTVRNSQPQRRRRQWEVPGAAGSGPGTSGSLEQRVAGNERRWSSSDGTGDRAVAAAGAPQVSIISPSSPAQERTFNPTPPASRPTSRPGSRPTGNTGDANAAAFGHHPPSSPPAYSEQDARQHSSPERPRSHRVSSTGANPGARGGAMLPISEIAIPDVTFSANLSAGDGSEGQIPEIGQVSMVDAGSAGSFQLAVGPLAPCERTAELIFPVSSSSDANSGPQKAGPGRGQGPGLGSAGPRDKEEYLRKLSALKRSVPHEPLKRVTEDGGTQAGAVAAADGAGSGGGSAGPSRKWMDPGAGDAPLSLVTMEAVGSGPAAVRAARSRNLTADVLQGSKPRGSDVGVGSDAVDTGQDSTNDTASTAARMARPFKAKSQVHHGRSGSFGDMAVAVSSLSGATEASRISDSGQCTRVGPHVPSPPHSPSRVSPTRGPKVAQQGPGLRTQQQQQQHVDGAGGEAPSTTAASAALAISAEQYMAFAVQNPEVAMAAAQAAINAGGSKARARWNVPPPEAAAAPQPPPPGLVAADTAAAGGPPPWVHHQQAPPLPPPPQQQQLAAAMVSATSHGIPAVPLLCSPSQMPQPGAAQVLMGDTSHDLRRANSEGPRVALGRGPGSVMLDMASPLGGPPTSAPSGHGPGGFGPLPPSVSNVPFYGGGHPPQPPVQPPIVQSLFPGNGVQVFFPSGGQGNSSGLPEGSGRHVGFGPGALYPSALQPIRPAMAPSGEVWAGGPGGGSGPAPPLPQSGFPPPQPPHWNGYAYVPGGRPAAYTGMHGAGTGPVDAHGPMSHTGPIGDPYKPLFKRSSNGHYDGFGGAGLGYASAPQAVSGPGGGSGGGAAGSSDLPDYLRVSMSRMVAGWSAPNAKHGALSGFNDVWQHRNNNRPPAGSVTATHSGGGGSGLPGSDSMAQDRDVSIGGGGVREIGFEGLSLAEVLASKPKKEVPNFKKKT